MTNDVTEAGFLRPKVVGWEHFAPEPARELRELSKRVVDLEDNDKVKRGGIDGLAYRVNSLDEQMSACGSLGHAQRKTNEDVEARLTELENDRWFMAEIEADRALRDGEVRRRHLTETLRRKVDKIAKHDQNLKNLDETLTGWEADQSAVNGEFRQRLEALEKGAGKDKGWWQAVRDNPQGVAELLNWAGKDHPAGNLLNRLEEADLSTHGQGLPDIEKHIHRAESRLVEALEDDDPDKAAKWLDVLDRLNGGSCWPS